MSVRVICNMPAGGLYYGFYYDPGIREVAQRMKKSEHEALFRAAQLMAPMIPQRSHLIPMPCSVGFASHTYLLCRYLQIQRQDLMVFDILRFSRPLSCNWKDMKKAGIKVFEEKMECSIDPRTKRLMRSSHNLYLVDNVYATGATFEKAKKALPMEFQPWAHPLVFAYLSSQNLENEYKKSKQWLTRNAKPKSH